MDSWFQNAVPSRRWLSSVTVIAGLGRQGLAHPGHGRRVGGRALQEAAVAAHRLLVGVARDAGEGRVDPDQRVVGLARVGDGEGDVGGDDGPVAQHLQLGVGVGTAPDALDLEQDDERELLGVARLRQREAGHPQQPVGAVVVLGAVAVAAAARDEAHRLARDRLALGHQRQRSAGARQRRAGEVGQAGRGAPGVDVDRQPHVAGHLHRRGVGVGDRAGLLVDEQHGHRDVGQDGGQRGGGGVALTGLGDQGADGRDQARLPLAVRRTGHGRPRLRRHAGTGGRSRLRRWWLASRSHPTNLTGAAGGTPVRALRKGEPRPAGVPRPPGGHP
jgi:hypothetical protein